MTRILKSMARWAGSWRDVGVDANVSTGILVPSTSLTPSTSLVPQG